MDEMTITKAQLEAALLQWELNFRAGKTRTIEECKSISAQQQAKKSADYFWHELAAQAATV